MKYLNIAFLGIMVCLSLQNTAFAQITKDKHRDQVWIFGTDASGSSGVDGTLLNFTTDPPNVKYVSKPIEMYITDASICDTAGNLILYTNGHALANRKHKILSNSIGFYSGEFVKGLGLAMPQGVLILPQPKSDSLYVVIHPLTEPSNDIFGVKAFKMQYTLIDMSRNNGEGAAILLNQVVVNDTFDNGMYTACRHANGRDWWVLLPKLSSNIYYRLLLDPTGLHVDGHQAIGPLLGSRSTLSQATFSPDGTRYARTRAHGYSESDTMGVYDFDRCTGLLSNVRFITHSTDSALVGATLAISPNSRYLYKSLGQYMWQYDLQAADVKASRKLVYTATKHGFFAMQLGPDGKIYICPAGGSYVLSRIDYPDLPGPACGVCEGCVTFPTPNFGSMPNFPNFRLGPLKGSPCDTLGLSGAVEVAAEAGGYRFFPNPVADVLTVEAFAPSADERSLEVTDVLGRIVARAALDNRGQSAQVSLEGMASGVYWLRVREKGKAVFSSKVVKL